MTVSIGQEVPVHLKNRVIDKTDDEATLFMAKIIAIDPDETLTISVQGSETYKIKESDIG